MNIIVIVIEIIILTVLFTAAVRFNSKNPADTVYDMPQSIINLCLKLGLIDETKKADSRETRLRKLIAALIIARVLTLILYFVNGVENFLQGFFISYFIFIIISLFRLNFSNL